MSRSVGLAVIFLFLLCQSFAQTDSFLQSLIDSVKAETVKPASSVKDSQKRATKNEISKRDTVKAAITFKDTASIFKEPSSIISTDSSLQKDSTAVVASPVLVS